MGGGPAAGGNAQVTPPQARERRPTLPDASRVTVRQAPDELVACATQGAGLAHFSAASGSQRPAAVGAASHAGRSRSRRSRGTVRHPAQRHRTTTGNRGGLRRGLARREDAAAKVRTDATRQRQDDERTRSDSTRRTALRSAVRGRTISSPQPRRRSARSRRNLLRTARRRPKSVAAPPPPSSANARPRIATSSAAAARDGPCPGGHPAVASHRPLRGDLHAGARAAAGAVPDGEPRGRGEQHHHQARRFDHYDVPLPAPSTARYTRWPDRRSRAASS